MPDAAKKSDGDRRHEEEQEFREWLRQTARRLKSPDLPPEDEELTRPRFDDPEVQRRIADLITRIAAKPDREQR